MIFRLHKEIYVAVLIAVLLFAGVAGAVDISVLKMDFTLYSLDMEEEFGGKYEIDMIDAYKAELKSNLVYIGYWRKGQEDGSLIVPISPDDLNCWPPNITGWLSMEGGAVLSAAEYALLNDATYLFIDNKLISDPVDIAKLLWRHPQISEVEFDVFSMPDNGISGYRFHLIVSSPTT